MKKVLFFDAFNGVAGDMILGALIDLGYPVGQLEADLGRLQLGRFELRVKPVERQGLRGTDFGVVVPAPEPQALHHPHPPKESHHGTGLKWICRKIQEAGYHPWVSSTAIAIFERLGEAEAKVHGTSLDRVHFHEVGGIDSIVDIVGSCLGFHYFSIDEFYCSPLALGGGTVHFSHGTWPVPAPATAELLAGFPVNHGPVQSELTTPTGAAIVRSLAQPVVPKGVRYDRFGFGAGDREFKEIPNLLRVMLGSRGDSGEAETLVLLEANIDNMDAETLGHFMERALSEGALDVYYSSLHMKKSRPGVLLSLLCRPYERERMTHLIFSETSTLGVRWAEWQRRALERESRVVDTAFGPVQVKIGLLNGKIVSAWPEFEDLKRLSLESNVPLKRLRIEVMRSIKFSFDE